MLLSDTYAASPRSQINRIYPMCTIFFKVTHRPNGVREGREEPSNSALPRGGGGMLAQLPPVSLSLRFLPLHGSCALNILFIFRERRRGKEGEKHKYENVHLSVASCRHPTRDETLTQAYALTGIEPAAFSFGCPTT